MSGEPMDQDLPSQEIDQISGRPAVALWVASVLIVLVCAVIALFLIHEGVGGIQSSVMAPGQAAVPTRVRPIYTTGGHATAPDSVQRSHLDEYRWIDRQHGIVAVPIENAMRLLAGVPDTVAGGQP